MFRDIWRCGDGLLSGGVRCDQNDKVLPPSVEQEAATLSWLVAVCFSVWSHPGMWGGAWCALHAPSGEEHAEVLASKDAEDVAVVEQAAVLWASWCGRALGFRGEAVTSSSFPTSSASARPGRPRKNTHRWLNLPAHLSPRQTCVPSCRGKRATFHASENRTLPCRGTHPVGCAVRRARGQRGRRR